MTMQGYAHAGSGGGRHRPKTVYLCAPYSGRGTIEGNVERVRRSYRNIMRERPDLLVIAPHLNVPHAYDEAGERETAMVRCIQYLDLCDEVWVHGEPTAGMQAEIDHAFSRGIKIVFQPLPEPRQKPSGTLRGSFHWLCMWPQDCDCYRETRPGDPKCVDAHEGRCTADWEGRNDE